MAFTDHTDTQSLNNYINKNKNIKTFINEDNGMN
jgi:hypothetical protein